MSKLRAQHDEISGLEFKNKKYIPTRDRIYLERKNTNNINPHVLRSQGAEICFTTGLWYTFKDNIPIIKKYGEVHKPLTESQADKIDQFYYGGLEFMKKLGSNLVFENETNKDKLDEDVLNAKKLIEEFSKE
jgi:hypothetical protein